MKKQILFIITVLLFCAISNFIHADNWQYNSTTSKWEKNITPEILKFNALNTATARQHIVPALGGANPNPAITTGLSDGYFAVTGGQIGASDVSDHTSVRQAFVIPDTSVIAPHALRFAQNTATVTDGGKAGKFLGFVNLNWYLPQKYSGYAVSFKSRVYNAGTFGLKLLVYDASGTQLGTDQNINAAGWNTATFTQTGNRPVRFKISIPNDGNLIAYHETPEMLLTSATEPTTRTISVTKSGNGTITATYATVRDQDTQTFTFTPDTGEKLIRVLYNESSVTFSNNGNGTYSYTTPLLTANATLQADFSPQTFTGTGNWTETAKWNTGILPDGGTNIIVNGTLSINTAALSANINVPTGNQLTITTGNSLTIAPGKQLSVSGTFTNNGTIILQSNTSGTATVTGNVSGNATVEQYLPAGSERTWWYLASPVTGAAWTVFGSNQVGEYSETSRSYSTPFAATETLTAGKGYVVKMNAAQAANVYQFANKALNNGNISVPLTRTVSETLNNKRGFNLVGNPYPSYLNWELAHKASTNVRSTIWYRTKGASAMEFHTYNAALGVSVPTAASGYIPPMQAFWVKVDTDPVSPATVSNGTLNFTNAMRGHAIQGTTTPLKAPATNSLPLLRIALSNGSTSDETVIALHENASANFDQYDSEKMSNTGTSEVFTLAGTQELTINALPDSESSKLIPLGIRPVSAGSLSLSVSELKNLDNMQIILHDNVLKTETQLSLNESHNFTTDGTATNNRFSIEFRAPGMTTGLDNSDFADFNITVYSGKIQIQSPAMANGELIRVYSSNGQKIIEQTAEGNSTIIDHKLSSGIYFVKVSNYVQKIIVQ